MEGTDLANALTRCLTHGDRSDWECFMKVAQPVVAAGVLRSLTPFSPASRELVDDFIQETFLKMCDRDFRILRNFRGTGTNALSLYLKTIAASTVVDHFRSQSAQKKGAGKASANLADVAPRLAADDRQFADFERRQMIERVEKCLAKQEPRNRSIFWLYHRRGLTPRAIASLAGRGNKFGWCRKLDLPTY